MTTIKKFIMDALKKHDGLATLDQIYTYVSEQMAASNLESSDYKHTVRGTVHRLVKQREVIHGDNPRIYKLPKPNTKSPNF